MRFGGIVLVTALTLGACSSDPRPDEPEPGATTTTAAAPSVALPTMPPQASEDSPEGAAAFVAHYVDVFNYAAATGDVDELRRLSDPTCDGCERYADLYEKTYEAGGYFRGGDWKIGELRLEADEATFYATTPVEVSEGTFRESVDQEVAKDAGEKTTVSFAVNRASDSWQVTQLGLGGVQ